MTVEHRFLLSLGLIAISAASGYFARRRGWLRETVAGPLMTAVSVIGYPTVGFLAIWRTSLNLSAVWLPMLGGLQTMLMALIALAIGRRVFPDRTERGMVGFSSGIGNHGVTMAGFVIYLLFGDTGLGLSSVYAIYTFFAFVLLSYTIAQSHASGAPRCKIGQLMLRNLLHWRAAGLYACVAAIGLSVAKAPVPDAIERWHILDIIIHAVIIVAYFAIGLRLYFPGMLGMGKAIAVTLAVRHVVGPAIGLTLIGVTMLTPWPLTGLALKVFLIQSSVSMGVMGVAVANMFRIKPRETSALFIISSVVYLVVGVPAVLLIFG